MSISITNHALERYSKRIKKDDIINITSLSVDTRTRYQEELCKMYEHSKLIYEGKFTDHSETRFLLSDDIILITDLKETKLITLYRIDFGFDDETNRMLRNRLVKQLDLAKIELDNSNSDSSIELQQALESLDVLAAEKEDLQASLKAVNDSIAVTNDYINNIKNKSSSAKTKYDNIARQICYSINCKKALQPIS